MPLSILTMNNDNDNCNDNDNDNISGWCLVCLVFEYVMKGNAEIVDLIQLIVHDSSKYYHCKYMRITGIPFSYPIFPFHFIVFDLTVLGYELLFDKYRFTDIFCILLSSATLPHSSLRILLDVISSFNQSSTLLE